jgi:DNA-binding LacI/PurR family transcriptional regulator
MKTAGLRVSTGAVVESPLEEEGGYRAMEQLLSRQPRPTAVAIWSLAAAVGAMAAAKRAGVAVPGELSLVGFHDAPIVAYLDPPLTTVRMPLGEMAERSVDSLLELVAGRRVGDVVVRTPPALVLRASTGPPSL